jgi:hypothetical protein
MNEAQAALLLDPFAPESVGQKPKKNKQTGETVWLDYVGHAEVTERLCLVDPEWTYDFFAVGDDGGPLIRTSDDGKTAELWINLTVAGITRPGVGTVSTEAWSGEVAKELISDALRNAAMRFGVALDLWKKHAPIGQPQVATSAFVPGSQASPAPSQDHPARNSGPITQGQSRNLYRLWHHVLKLDKVEYLEQILIATGLGIQDDRTLDSKSASMVIRHLKEMAGEPVDDVQSAPTVGNNSDGDPGPQEPSWNQEPF